jgi:acyl carrier protein phosphodiesterase
MNYLAHLYLSGDEPGIIVGNFIGDHVKGKRFTRYPKSIQTGIILHRHIDTFTDKHPVFRESALIFKERYKRYAGVVVDIIYDHFLAANFSNYSQIDLAAFTSHSHRILLRHYFQLPARVKQFLPYLIKSRRLENYQYFEGIEKTLNIMSANSSLPKQTLFAMHQLETHYPSLQMQFETFMPEISSYSKAFITSPDSFYRFNHAMIP